MPLPDGVSAARRDRPRLEGAPFTRGGVVQHPKEGSAPGGQPAPPGGRCSRRNRRPTDPRPTDPGNGSGRGHPGS